MEAYISCLSGGANPAEITEYHVLSGLFLAADITAQQGEVLAINRCPYFHFGREKYLWGTDLHEVGHDPMYGGHFAQVDNGIQIIGAEALPSSVHVAFAAAKSVEETGVTAASATAITMDEVMDLYYSLRAPYRRNAVFIMNDSTIKAIRKLKNGNGDYLWQPSLTAGQPDTLLNRPIYTSSYMPAIAASNKVILFGDLGYYWVADREGRSFKRLNELYAATGQVGFLASQRVDGKLVLAEAVKVLAQKSA